MAAAIDDIADALGLSDVLVSIVERDGTCSYISEPLRSWISTNPLILETEGELLQVGRRWTVSHRELRTGQRVRIVKPAEAADAALLEQSRILEALIKAAPVAILTLDLQMKVTMWNPACERIFGWTPEDVLGKPYPLVPEDEWERFEGFFQTVIEGQGFTGVEAERHRKDGNRIHIAISTAPIYQRDGEVIGAMAVLEDITERKLLEARFQQAVKLEAVGRLAGGVAHDFNNILTVILAYCETLRSETDQQAIEEAVDAIQHSATRAARLTQQLLAFSRQQVLKAEVINLNDAVRATLEMITRLIGSDIEIHTDLHPTTTWVRVDPAQIEQILMNLATNARDVMPGGGRITLSTTHVEREGVPWARMSFADTGLGMSSETAAKIFEPFFTTKAKGKGTGLGLASVYGIVRQSGGDVEVESEEGSGTTFLISLPLQREPKAVAGQPEETVAEVAPSTILLAEDEPGVRNVLKTMLRSLGHEVLVAEDGVEAIKIAETHDGAIHVLLTDVVMPRMGGGELAQRLRQLRPGIKVLYTSGYADDEAVRRGAESGEHFLHKPFTANAVRDALRGVIDG